MAEYLKKNDVLKIINHTDVIPLFYRELLQEKIKLQDAAYVVEVRHGKWKFRKSWDVFVCSECSFEHTNYSHYCPNCGAKMDGKGGAVDV